MNPLLRDELAAIIAEAPVIHTVPAIGDSAHAPLDVSPRARKTRAVLRIADSHGWRSAIVHFLDMKGVAHMSDLTLPQLEDLLERMNGYVDAANTCCSLAECLPAN